MTEYIVHRRFKDKCLGGMVNLPYGTKCEETDGIIFCNGRPIAITTSENAYQYFARDDDSKGLERGKLIQMIIKKLHDNDVAWDKIWTDLSLAKFKRPEYSDFWVWNYNFYNAEIDDLKYILEIAKGAESV